MATIVLSAAGLAAGNALNGSILGLTTGVLGRAIGATIGRVIDQKIMGQGSETVETGKVDRFRLTGASEGSAIGQIYARMRVPGQVIWATRFKEHVKTSKPGGGKGAPARPSTTTKEYSYSISVAIALCEGDISGVGRIWADGQLIEGSQLTMRVYSGAQDQLPDPKIEAVEGVGNAPAYRGLAYVVLEDLDLTPFGNRIPQLSFEVIRPTPMELPVDPDVSEAVQAVALMPGTGEYALASSPVYYRGGFGENRAANLNSASGKTDLLTSLDGLRAELPNCAATSLIVSWFGDDLRCGLCSLMPKVEHKLEDGSEMPWVVSGVDRDGAEEIVKVEGRAIYGGTPTDQSVVEAIVALKEAGQEVTFYPFILMDQLDGNGLDDPYSAATDQPVLPWRGRITTVKAPGISGSTDQSAAAEAEVAAFFGAAAVADFTVSADSVDYAGPAEWSFRRFILHYAYLCAKAGGVDAFCIGSEMRGLTQIRRAGGSFPAVEALRALASDVRAILGAGTKIGYAADWSEYFGYHPQDGTGDVLFHLDPLWADPDIDFVGIDNYMPLSDWRGGEDHLDADWGAIYNLDYLRGNIAGGEGFDWYYASDAARDLQQRTPITDGAHSEPWVFRYKDLKNWWSQLHHNRIGGVRSVTATDWQPRSKPIWFTELGCAAVDKATNQPNKFLDPKSSESSLPYYSNGRRDDFVQAQYLRAMATYWADAAHNPASDVYVGAMVDMTKAHVWAWDARPYPAFPGNQALWSDGDNYLHGHWLNGRASSRSLAGVVAEICHQSGVTDIDVSGLYGVVRGYSAANSDTGRARLQPLMLAYGFDAIERDGVLVFRTRSGKSDFEIDTERLAVSRDADSDLTLSRAPEAELAGRLRLSFIESDAEFAARGEEAIFPDEATKSVAQSDLPLVLTQREARGIVERWLAESRVARDTAQFALPLSKLAVRAGDVVTLPDISGPGRYRIDRVEQSEMQLLEAVRIEHETYTPSDAAENSVRTTPFVAPSPVDPVFLDLPLLSGEEVPHAPHIAATARPWPGTVAIYSSAEDDGYEVNKLLTAASVIGHTVTPLAAAKAGLIDRSSALRVRLVSGDLSSASFADVLNGANAMAIGTGVSGDWEVFQFINADLVAERTYDLSHLLRGQAGTDGIMPDVWPQDSLVVLLNGAAEQIDLAQSARGLARHYRIGPAQRSLDDASYTHVVAAFDGVGLRPYAPVHLRALRDGAAGETSLSWIRRTRVDGDSWQSVEVPLGEDAESYQVRILQGGSVMREETVTTPGFTYSDAAKTADGVTGIYEIAVAQVSDRFGPGPFRRITINE